MKTTHVPGAAALALVLLLGACGQQGDGGNAAAAQANAAAPQQAGTLADAINGERNGQFARALQAAGLGKTLEGPGPYTVLVPTDQAFAKLPAGALDGLMKPESKTQLTGMLTYHILPGTMLAADISRAVDAGQGKAMLATMSGGTITAAREGDRLVLTDGRGGKAVVTTPDEQRSNGVIHRVDTVLMPAAGGSETAPPSG
ncbi:fasciclin domain-containing protein [Sphingomonas sp. GCM10030256]|uniref:fasciclin domain-containing protein n=1 Tax=Sphingomonas sp. GCM10030256 TaxID=3273427 RepID=UPI0036187F4E